MRLTQGFYVLAAVMVMIAILRMGGVEFSNDAVILSMVIAFCAGLVST